MGGYYGWNWTTWGWVNAAKRAVAVSDNRGKANSSWAIKVRQATQFTAGDSTLDGAVLTVDTGTLTNNLSSPPTGTSDIANGELDFAAINNEYAFLTANAGEGIGETSMPLEQLPFRSQPIRKNNQQPIKRPWFGRSAVRRRPHRAVVIA